MRSRWILNIILAAMVVGLAVFAYLRPHTDKTPAPITELNVDTITRIGVERDGQPSIKLEKTAAGWRMRAPLSARANPFNAESLLRIVTTPSEYQTAATPEDLTKFGLDKPLLRLRFDDDELVVGAIHPLKQQHYIQYRKVVHLVPSQALAAALRDYTSLLDTQLLEDERHLAALYLPHFQVVRNEDTWRREPPIKDLSGDRINEFVAHWQNAHALSVEKRSAKPSLDKIRLISENNGKRETLVLDILAYKPEFILARGDEGLEYHFPEDVGRQMLNLNAE